MKCRPLKLLLLWRLSLLVTAPALLVIVSVLLVMVEHEQRFYVLEMLMESQYLSLYADTDNRGEEQHASI
jgi:hypothetical protein